MTRISSDWTLELPPFLNHLNSEKVTFKMEGSYTISIKVTQEMEDTLKGIFANCGWDYDELVTRPPSVTQQCSHNTNVRESRVEGNLPNPDQGPDYHMINHVEDDQCPHCFLAPCVTQRPNTFLGNGQAACVENSGLRKTFYRGYWKAINYLGGWNIPACIRKKLTAGYGEWVLRHRREVIPFCVLKQVRSLYPNPPEKPYMGHKWE